MLCGGGFIGVRSLRVELKHLIYIDLWVLLAAALRGMARMETGYEKCRGRGAADTSGFECVFALPRRYSASGPYLIYVFRHK